MKGRGWSVFSLIVFLAFLHAGSTQAATINAASCSQSDVQSAINSAAKGDTVKVPAGNCTWSSIVNLGSKPITLQGAGVGQTNIVHNASGSQAHVLQFTEDGSLPTRITGFSFSNLVYDRRAIQCSGSYSSAPMRIDHNDFLSTTTANGGTIEVELYACVGLIDHNTFEAPDNSELIHNWGPGTSGWSTSVTPGSYQALYVEDNVFTNNSNNFNAQSAMQSYDAAHIVARHNQFNNNQVDTHGGSNIGTRWFEFYENNFCTTGGYSQDKYFDIRAGSGVVFNNHHNGSGSTCSNPGSSGAAIIFRDESRSGDARYDVGEGINRDHWSPAYAWGNDSSMSVGIGSGSTRIQQGVNFIVASTQPQPMKRWELSTDTASSTYSYVPFVYPYPLDANGFPNPLGSGPDLPAPPTGLRVSVT